MTITPGVRGKVRDCAPPVVAASAPSPIDVADYLLRGELAPVVMLSGCSWECSGGGQRPVWLARVLAQQGHGVGYSSNIETLTRLTEAVPVAVVAYHELDRTLYRVLGSGIRPGVLIATYGTYLPHARALKAAGWKVVYDLIDNWDAFAAAGEIVPGTLDGERELVPLADIVTCSAAALVDRAERLGARRTVLVPNAGPAEPIVSSKRPADMLLGERASLVYVGCLLGSWFDWTAVETMLAVHPEWALTVIGRYDNAPEWKNARFLGELPFDRASKYLPWADVGLIPFRDATLCASVDPIKWYDYQSAGLPVAATDVMTDIAGRPRTHLAPAGDLATAVTACLREKRPAAAEVQRQCREHSWDARATDILEALTPPRRAARRSKPLTPADCKLRVSWQAPASCNMHPACGYCSSFGARAGKPALPFSPGVILAGFTRLAAERGPLYLSACFGDPMSDAGTRWVLGELALANKVDIVTNARFQLRALDDLPRNGNVAFATSFHWHAWKSIAEFVARRRAIERLGYTCGTTEICGHPDALPHLEQWRAELVAAGITTSFLPFQGYHGGKAYPAAYTAAERAMISGAIAANYQYAEATVEDGITGHPRGRQCRAGSAYCYVTWEGTVQRCCTPSETLGSVYPAYSVRLLDGAVPCDSETCPCPDLWRYSVGE